ncbi:MAG: hypothetical protein M3Q13_00395 [Pseudomonadota bacterium]|nr:hypothetical protein [Pseudomonadota bacterium]
MSKLILSLSCACLLSLPGMAPAQQLAFDPDAFDPTVLMAGTEEIVRRAPDSSIDSLFQAVHAAAQVPAEAKTICALFEPDADRSVEGFSAAANSLGDASREGFISAITDIAVAGLQGQPQPYDAAVARQALKSAGARAAILHEGFIGGLTATGIDADTRDARCRSLRWMLDSLKTQPLGERAAATRLMLNEGLSRLNAGQ